MKAEKKPQAVEQIARMLSENRFVVATDYRGLSVAEISELRGQLRTLGSEYHVVKNSLARFAAANTGNQELDKLLIGPTALAVAQDDIPKLAKALIDYIRVSKSSLTLKGGLLDGRLLEAAEITRIATLPPVEVLRAKVLGLLVGPVFALQNVLSANLRGLNTVLNARIQQLGGTADA